MRMTEDIVKACLDPTNASHVYYAVDLSPLPSVDAKHCDVTAILMELQSLRAKVREIGHLRHEAEQLKVELAKAKDNKTSFIMSLLLIMLPALELVVLLVSLLRAATVRWGQVQIDR